MSAKKRPIRTCVACRSSDEKNGLLRIVRSSTGEIAIDPTGKKPGRGAYICRKPECVAAAAKRKALDRALRAAVPVELIERLRLAVMGNENADR
jgi:predicted RNA-binding protein YlxR (DUF448 family)